MSSASESTASSMGADLNQRVGRLIDTLIGTDPGAAAEAFESLMGRANDLWRRKQAMEGTKSETRDLLGEVLFSRLRQAFREFHEGDDAATEIRAAEWVLGMLFSGTALTEFATALDRAMLEAARPQDFSFAGRADFISVEEVLQLLSSGKYNGMLAIEKDDNRLDIYIDRGMVVCLDPHHLVRRVFSNKDRMAHKEISPEDLKKAEQIKKQDGVPLLLGLQRSGVVDEAMVEDLMQNLGLEVLYEFLAEQGACTFFYKRLEQMPDFAQKYGHPMPVTPILLEGSKRNDDWQALLKVFPHPEKPIRPQADMFARIAGMDMGVLEIKLLAMINGETSPRQLAPNIGLPLFDVYQHLVRFAREEIIVPDGGLESLHDVSFSLEESMEMAFEALDANDDQLARDQALDGVLGDFDPDQGEEPAEGGSESFLDILAQTDFKQGDDA